MDRKSFVYKKSVPKKIWQTGFNDFDKLEEPFVQNVKTWQKMNPHWQYVYKNEKEKIDDIKDFGDELLIELSHFVTGPYLADLWRYITLYRYGGVYVDLDSVCWAPLDLLSYVFTSTETTTWITREELQYGYTDNTEPYEITDHGDEICIPCKNFQEIFGLGVSSNGRLWMSNNAFACYPKSEAIGNVLDVIRDRYQVFKDLHKGTWNLSHTALSNIVDCSAFDVGISKDMTTVSRTFIGDIQGFTRPDLVKEGSMFKDYYEDFYILHIKRKLFSELDEETKID
jgi:hypothetical protein